MKYITINPMEWTTKHSAERTYISDFDGSMTQALLLGGWSIQNAVAESRHYLLKASTEYVFGFWLNGGENEKQDEVCKLTIFFYGEGKMHNDYKLNRNYVKPRLRYQGWEYYVIPFITPASSGEIDDSIDTQFYFVSSNAPMALKRAQEPEYYTTWEDQPDPYADLRPQRHNMVFADGWPSRGEYGGDRYSTEVVSRMRGNLPGPVSMAHQPFVSVNPSDRISEKSYKELERRIDVIAWTHKQQLQKCDDMKTQSQEMLMACRAANLIMCEAAINTNMERLMKCTASLTKLSAGTDKSVLTGILESAATEGDAQELRTQLTSLENTQRMTEDNIEDIMASFREISADIQKHR